MNKKACIAIFFLLFILFVPTGCGGNAVLNVGAPLLGHTEPVVLTAAAASSLQFALPEIAAAYKEKTGIDVVLVFGATGTLVQQIENGAPYDLIIAADTGYVERLAEGELVDPESMAIYAYGSLVLAVNKDFGVVVTEMADLLDSDVTHLAVANPLHAPYGVAAVQSLTSARIWEALEPKIVYGENVRQVLQYVQTGDAQAGIIPLALADVPEISWTAVDPSSFEPVAQMLAIVSSSQFPEEAHAFTQFILGEEGQAILSGYGFGSPFARASLDGENGLP